jgi:protein-S-isoprenylcysteine O-methyltransferase Ste14
VSQITADKLSVTSDSPMASRYPAMNRDNITLPKGAFGVAFMALLVLGLAGLGGVAYAYFAVDAKHAIGSWMVGAFSVLGIALGGLFFTLVFHLTNAGWSALLRRQFENAAAMIPLACLLIIPILVAEGRCTSGSARPSRVTTCWARRSRSSRPCSSSSPRACTC